MKHKRGHVPAFHKGAAPKRINVVLEKPLYDSIRRLAKKEDISLSLKIRNLVRQAVEAEEDAALAQFAEEREKSFKRSRALTHKQVWGS